MTETQIELLKIILDKGLLAIVLLGVAFYLNRVIERYKAANVYHQKISETRIQAYQEVSEALHMQMLQIQKIINIIAPNPYPIEDNPNREQEANALMEAYNKYKDSYIEHSSIMGKNSIFFSYDFGDKLLKYLKQIERFKVTFEIMSKINLSAVPNDWKKYAEHVANMQDISKCLQDDVADMQSTLRKEVHNNPFS